MSFFSDEIRKCFHHSKLVPGYTILGRAAYIVTEPNHGKRRTIIKAEFTGQRPRVIDALRLTALNSRSGVMDRATIYFQDVFPSKKAANREVNTLTPYIQVNVDSAAWVRMPSDKDYQAVARAIDNYIKVFCGHDFN